MDRKLGRGRPLDRSRDGHILHTAIGLLREVGFDAFRVQDVAERAKVGLGTMYRRWPTRDSLIVAAFGSVIGDVGVDDARDLDGLRRQLGEMADTLNTEQADLLPGLIAASHRDDDLAKAIGSALVHPRLTALKTAVHATAGASLTDEEAGLLAEIGPGILLLRLLLTQEPVTDDVVDRIVDELIRPLLVQHSGTPVHPRRVGRLERQER